MGILWELRTKLNSLFLLFSGITWSGHLLWEGVVPGTSPSTGSDFKVRWESSLDEESYRVHESSHGCDDSLVYVWIGKAIRWAIQGWEILLCIYFVILIKRMGIAKQNTLDLGAQVNLRCLYSIVGIKLTMVNMTVNCVAYFGRKGGSVFPWALANSCISG
jgi:hypothetical protein